jgi:hypothetical protein
MTINNRLQKLWQLKSIKITLIFMVFFVLFHLFLAFALGEKCDIVDFIDLECEAEILDNLFLHGVYILNFSYLVIAKNPFPIYEGNVVWELFKSGVLSAIIVFLVAHLILLAIGKFGNNRK